MNDVNALPKKSLDFACMKTRFLIIVFVMLAFQVKIFLQWQPASGPHGSLIRSFATLGNDVFAATSGGVFVTSDNRNQSFKKLIKQ